MYSLAKLADLQREKLKLENISKEMTISLKKIELLSFEKEELENSLSSYNCDLNDKIKELEDVSKLPKQFPALIEYNSIRVNKEIAKIKHKIEQCMFRMQEIDTKIKEIQNKGPPAIFTSRCVTELMELLDRSIDQITKYRSRNKQRRIMQKQQKRSEKLKDPIYMEKTVELLRKKYEAYYFRYISRSKRYSETYLILECHIHRAEFLGRRIRGYCDLDELERLVNKYCPSSFIQIAETFNPFTIESKTLGPQLKSSVIC